jgi:ATP-binding cassette, subfamily B, bacterial
VREELRRIFHMAARVWRTLSRRDHTALVIATVIMIATGLLTSVPPLVLGYLVDAVMRLGTGNVFHVAIPLIGLMIAAIVVREALQVLRKYLVETVCTRVEKQQLLSIISHVLRIDASYADEHQATGALHGRIHRSVEGFVRILKLSFLEFFPVMAAAGCALSIAMYRRIGLAGVMGLVIPGGFLIVLLQLSSQKGIRLNLLRAKEAIDGKVVELLGGREYIRVAHTEDYEVTKIEEVAEGLRRKEIKHHISMALFDALKYLNEGFFYVLVLCLSLYMVSGNRLSPGEVLSFSLLFTSVLLPLREVHRIIDEAHESSLRVSDFFDLLALPVDRSYATTMKPGTTGIAASDSPLIEVRNVSFTYSGANNGAKTLSSLGFTINEGERVGIAGASGCGKSTVLKLLLRILHPDSGEILIGGRSLTTISRGEIATIYGYVSQAPFIFAGTVMENIAYGTVEPPSASQIAAAARKANIHEEIMAMPEQYNALVAEGGRNLSGGQRQRIALARIFLQNPSVLLLDEATSALDSRNEQLVQRALAEAMQGRTVVTVAHRLTTLQQTDRILVVDEGRVVESGSYDDLLKKGAKFSAIVRPHTVLHNDEQLTLSELARS